MIAINMDKVSKRFAAPSRGWVSALDEICLNINPGELFFLLGPSGCGKTTALRILAGLESPDQGQVSFGEKLMNGVPAHKRASGMVFQHYALWPHLSVFENVAYGLKVRKVAGSEIKSRVQDALSMVKMQDYAKSRPAQLSGGQQQRIALARALVIRPQVLLLDEPLSNLDAKLRAQMRTEISAIHQAAETTTVYVTHDQEEALSMADRIALMNKGHVEQVGEPLNLYKHPKSRFVAEFLGEANFIPGTVIAIEKQVRVKTALGVLSITTQAQDLKPKDEVTLMVRPEDIAPASETQAGIITVQAGLISRSFMGDRLKACFAVNPDLTLTATLNPREIKEPQDIEKITIHTAALLEH